MLSVLRPFALTTRGPSDSILAPNLTSSYRLIRSLEPLLRASDCGRAVFVTCEQATAPSAFWGAYAASKAGLEAMVRCWADEVDGSAIRALIVDPGPTRTALRHQAFPGEDKEKLTDPTAIGPMIVDLLSADQDPGPPSSVVTFRDWAPFSGAGAAPGTP
jgi:NAD(P)-dependent dehydrogenase (short-subunit alcohol dehydrogenase family)